MVNQQQSQRWRMWELAGRLVYYVVALGLLVYFRIGTRVRVLIVSGDSVLLVQPWMGTGKWQLPGGGLRHHEDPIVGAQREVHEEIGISLPPNTKAIGQFVAKGWEHYRYTLFRAQFDTQPALQLRKSEILYARWFTQEELASGHVMLDSATARHIKADWR